MIFCNKFIKIVENILKLMHLEFILNVKAKPEKEEIIKFIKLMIFHVRLG